MQYIWYIREMPHERRRSGGEPHENRMRVRKARDFLFLR